ncbi:Hsp20/alpha crystallin family protein [Patescibacteria group bacterium]|nr:Hsp20/alpha crystallin family protein [Patescibacteria group bacterium]
MDSFFEKLISGDKNTSIEKKPLEKKQKVAEEDKPEEIKSETKPSFAKAPAPAKALTDKSAGKEEWFTPEGKLAIDVYQTDLDIVIQTPIAGVKKGDLDISIENDMVIIKGNREKPSGIEEKNYFYQECYWGPFSRQIILPVEGDPSRIKATMKDGILTLKIPKIERERKRKVEIK